MNLISGNNVLRTVSSFLSEHWSNLTKGYDSSQLNDLLDKEIDQFKKKKDLKCIISFENKNYRPDANDTFSSSNISSLFSEPIRPRKDVNVDLPQFTKQELIDFYTEIIIKRSENKPCCSRCSCKKRKLVSIKTTKVEQNKIPKDGGSSQEEHSDSQEENEEEEVRTIAEGEDEGLKLENTQANISYPQEDASSQHKSTLITKQSQTQPPPEIFIQKSVQSGQTPSPIQLVQRQPPSTAAIHQYLQPNQNQRMQTFPKYKFPPCSLFGYDGSRIKFNSQGEIAVPVKTSNSLTHGTVKQGNHKKVDLQKEVYVNTEATELNRGRGYIDANPQTSNYTEPPKPAYEHKYTILEPCRQLEDPKTFMEPTTNNNNGLSVSNNAPQIVTEKKLYEHSTSGENDSLTNSKRAVRTEVIQNGDNIGTSQFMSTPMGNYIGIRQYDNKPRNGGIAIEQYNNKPGTNDSIDIQQYEINPRNGVDARLCHEEPKRNVNVVMQQYDSEPTSPNYFSSQQSEGRPGKLCFPRQFKKLFRRKKPSEIIISTCSAGNDCECKSKKPSRRIRQDYLQPGDTMCIQRKNKDVEKELKRRIKEEEKQMKKWKKQKANGEKNMYKVEQDPPKIKMANKTVSNTSLYSRTFDDTLVKTSHGHRPVDFDTQRVQTSVILTADNTVQARPSTPIARALQTEAESSYMEQRMQTSGILTIDRTEQAAPPGTETRSVEAMNQQKLTVDANNQALGISSNNQEVGTDAKLNNKCDCCCAQNTVDMQRAAEDYKVDMESLKTLIKMQTTNNQALFDDIIKEMKSQKSDIKKLYVMYEKIVDKIQTPQSLPSNDSDGIQTEPMANVTTGIQPDALKNASKGVKTDRSSNPSKAVLTCCHGDKKKGLKTTSTATDKMKNVSKGTNPTPDSSKKIIKRDIHTDSKRIDCCKCKEFLDADKAYAKSKVDMQSNGSEKDKKNLINKSRQSRENIIGKSKSASTKDLLTLYKNPKPSVKINEKATVSSISNDTTTEDQSASESENTGSSTRSWPAEIFQWVKSSIQKSECKEKFNKCKEKTKEKLIEHNWIKKKNSTHL